MSEEPPEPTPLPEAPPPEPAPLPPEREPEPPLAVEAEREPPKERVAGTTSSPILAALRRYAFLAVPAVALFELGAHLVETHTVVSDEEWLAARDAIRAIVKPEDLVVTAPYWTDPVARELWKDEILSLAREARPDATRFPRAIEASIRGKHLPELEGWRVESTKKVGPITLTVLDNPSYRPLKDDLVTHAAPGRMVVSVVGPGGEVECTYGRSRVETGGLGFGPAIPAGRFSCPQSGMLAATVMQPADYRPHRCLFVPPLGPGRTLRVRFLDVAFGQTLHGHAGIDWDSTAKANEPPVTLVWKLEGRPIGRIVAGNNDGWKPFELDTRDVEGQRGDIVAEVSSPASRDRFYCFEADTR